MVDVTLYLDQFSKVVIESFSNAKRSIKSNNNESPLIASGVVLFSVLAVQAFTEADPIGKSVRFFRQLKAQVCSLHYSFRDII